MIQGLTDFYLDFKFQEYMQEITGEFIPLDALEMTRKMLNLFSPTEHRLDLLEAQQALRDQSEIDTSKLQSVFKVKIEPIE